MQIFPDSSAFEIAYSQGTPQLVWTKLTTDLATPISSMLKLIPKSEYHFLFESVEGGEKRGRYSIIGLDPQAIWRCINGKAELAEDGINFTPCPEDMFTSLRKFVKQATLDIPAELPPMASGIFGYMGYDMVKFMEKLPDENPDTIGIPNAVYFRPHITVIFDSVKDEALIITPVFPNNDDAKIAYENAQTQLQEIIDILQQPGEPEQDISDAKIGPFTSHTEEAAYCDIVEKAKEYIVAGDIFQVVPSRRLEGDFTLPPFALYRSLRRLNPSPYLFYLHMKDFALVGSSPEILVRLRDNVVTIRPIAGTRPRGNTPEEDKALEEDLLSDQKELAEHLMLLDLGRNDVGRVTKGASVRVTEQMIIERYSHVMHIVSNVEGDIKPDLDAIDALIAGFPAGTVSGAPKIRAMEIIDELESEKRSFYGGTVGYISANGSMDTCIALRTGLVKDGKLTVQAGGGVVADSNPKSEFEETENKARALIKAAEIAGDFT